MKKKELIVILQARCSSRRLPKKVLKKICGVPLVILCAKSLSNRGAQVIVATSKDKTDNNLAKLLAKNKINYYRGSLPNVLSRYQFLAKRFKKDDYIVRATADNAFPDGEIVEIIQAHVKKIKTDYYGINHKTHNLPKGVGIEIFTVKKILSLNKNLRKEDKEHVTLSIYRNSKKYLKQRLINKIIPKKDMSNISVTIDEKKEFKLVEKIFSNFKNPIKVSYKKLLKSL